MNWKSMETAPKDGSEILLGFKGSLDMDFYRWNDGLGEWLDRTSDPPHEEPTHWLIIEPPT